MMLFLHGIAMAAWMFAAFVITGLPVTLYDRLLLAGVYFLLGTVAASASAILRRLP
jgi:hypothetical protein